MKSMLSNLSLAVLYRRPQATTWGYVPLPDTEKAAEATFSGAQFGPRGPTPAKRTFPTISLPLPFYAAYIKRHAQALRTTAMPARAQVVDYVNKTLMPRLHTEEAALQLLLAPIANMHWQVGWKFSLFINKNLAGLAVDTYAKDYVVQTIFSHPQGGFGIHLRPTEALSKQADMLLVPGTYCLRPGERDSLAIASGRPVGIRDDLRWRGIGQVSAANIKPFADACLADAALAGRQLVVAGHSLGSAVALRWLASLQPHEQNRVDLLAYVPPGLDKATARKLEAAAANIRLFPHFWDVVRFSGLYRAPGRETMVRDYVREGDALKSHHALPHLAIRELRGEKPQVSATVLQPARFVFFSPILELFRRLFGALLWPLLPN